MDRLTKQLSKLTIANVSLMVLTSIHHFYGSIIYETPWRNHILFFSIPVIIINIIANRILQQAAGNFKTLLFRTNWLVILISLTAIGLFEGIYNHVLKNVFFFSGVDDNLFKTLFPPPVYEMPNDFVFETTGILQGVIAVFLAAIFVKFTKAAISGSSKNFS